MSEPLIKDIFDLIEFLIIIAILSIGISVIFVGVLPWFINLVSFWISG